MSFFIAWKERFNMRLADTFRKVIISAWMPFAACMLLLLYLISVDLLESIWTVQTFWWTSVLNSLVAVVFLSLLAFSALLAIYFLIRRNWRQFFWRIILVVAGIDILFLAGERWSDYAREHLPKSLEIHVAGPQIAVVNDKLITDNDSLTELGRKLLKHADSLKAVFVCEADIQSSDFAHNFAFPCLSAGIWRFAFSVPSGDSTRGNIKEIPFYVASEPDFKSAGNNKGVIIETRIKEPIATVKLSADGTPSFSTDFDPFEHSPEKSSFSSTEESVLGEGRGAEFTVAIVLADPGCRLSDITRTIRRLHESGYKAVLLYFV